MLGKILSPFFYNSGRYGERSVPGRVGEYLLGVTQGRQDINRIKPRFFDMVRGDVLEVGGYDDYFKRRHKSGRVLNLDRYPGRHVDIVADAENMPEVESAAFGGAICISVLEHTNDPDAIVDELHRCLADGALLMLSTPWLFEEHMSPADYHRFSQSRIEAMLEGRFEIIEAHHANGYIGLLAHALQQSLPLRFGVGWPVFLASLVADGRARAYSTQFTVIARKAGPDRSRAGSSRVS